MQTTKNIQDAFGLTPRGALLDDNKVRVDLNGRILDLYWGDIVREGGRELRTLQESAKVEAG